MAFMLAEEIQQEEKRFDTFLQEHLTPHVSQWYRDGTIPSQFYRQLGAQGWYGFAYEAGQIVPKPALRNARLMERLARYAPGVAVAVFTAHIDLGFMGLYLFGSDELKQRYAPDVLSGDVRMCLGNTENIAGSDVAGIAMQADPVEGGWRLNGTKAYVTNGLVADLAVVTAVTDADAPRSQRMSMFLVDLNQEGVQRTKLDKDVWIPSDLTRLQLKDVFVPQHHLLGVRGKGLAQVLKTFTHSRVPISALTVGTAAGAFEKGVAHARKRRAFGRRLIDFQAKGFEMAALYAHLEAARLMVWQACAAMDSGNDFRLEASMAKYLSVNVARDVSTWAADLFGAASVVREHPIHKYPLDTWAAALGEGTQDVHKLVIWREVLRQYAD